MITISRLSVRDERTAVRRASVNKQRTTSGPYSKQYIIISIKHKTTNHLTLTLCTTYFNQMYKKIREILVRDVRQKSAPRLSLRARV